MNKEKIEVKKNNLQGIIYSDVFCEESNNCKELIVLNNGDEEMKLAFSDDCKQTNKIIDNKGTSAHEDLVKISELLKKFDEKEVDNGR